MIGLETALVDRSAGGRGRPADPAGSPRGPVAAARPRSSASGAHSWTASPADLVVFDPNAHWRVDATTLASRSSNTPLLGMELPGVVRLTVANGRVTYDDGLVPAREDTVRIAPR